MSNQNGNGNVNGNVVQPPIQPIDIMIGTDAALTFNKPAKLGGGKSTIYLHQPLRISIPACNILIGDNKYVAVSQWDIQVQKLKPFKHILPVGINVLMENGITTAITAPLEVELPMACNIKLLARTKLQQQGNPVRLVLEADCDAILKFDN